MSAFHVEETGGALGAFITGIDLTRQIDPDVAARLRRAAVMHKVIFLPDQHMTLDDLERLSGDLGGLTSTPFVKPLPDRPMVIRVLKEADAKVGFGEAWHTDLSYLAEPPAFTCLWASDIPPNGGDTMWANQAAAYAALDDATKAEIAGLRGLHSAGRAYGTGGYYEKVQDQLSMPIAPSEAAYDVFAHPLVVRHPETGEAVLFANQTYTIAIEGWDKERSDALLKRLFTQGTDMDFVYRLKWRPHMLAIWDNRATQHFAINDYHGHRREMYRTSVAGSALRPA